MSMSGATIFRCWLFSLSMAAMVTSAARGQPIFAHVDSLEWMAADARVIVRATVVGSTRERTENNDFWETVTAKVHETLKGTHQPTVTFVIRNFRYDEDLARWKQQQQELLLFFVDSERLKESDAKYTEQELALLPRVYWKRSCVELDKEAKSKLLTMDLEAPTDPQVILRLTRAAVAAAAQAKPAGRHVVRWPGTLPKRSAWYGHHAVFLTVPIDDRLEAQARKCVKRKAAWFRAEGAKALGHFSSDANVTILKTLLDDPAHHDGTIEEGQWAAVRQREFYVRQAALAALKKWGVPIRATVVSEELLRKVTDPKQREAVAWIKGVECDVCYHDMERPGAGAGPFRTVQLVNFASASLHGHRVDDLSLLATLEDLENLTLTSTHVRDLSPLAGLKSLRTLRLWDTPVTDLSPLAKLKTLDSLELGGPVSDLSPLAGLEGLESLDLSHTRVCDLGPLAKLKNLRSLDLPQTPIGDFSPLAALTGLEDLNLCRTQIGDLAPLAGLKNLKALRLDDTPVSDLAPLTELKKLETLDLARTQVSDLAPLAKLEHLERLDVSDTPVSDVSPLKGMKSLYSVSLGGTLLSEEEARLFRESLWD